MVVKSAVEASKIARTFLDESLRRPILSIEEVHQDRYEWIVFAEGLGTRYEIRIDSTSGDVKSFKKAKG